MQFILESSAPGLRFFCADSWLLVLLFIRHVLRLTAHDSFHRSSGEVCRLGIENFVAPDSVIRSASCAPTPHGGSQKQGYGKGRSQNCVKVGHYLGYVSLSCLFVFWNRTP
jgi:hypothetical protein